MLSLPVSTLPHQENVRMSFDPIHHLPQGPPGCQPAPSDCRYRRCRRTTTNVHRPQQPSFFIMAADQMSSTTNTALMLRLPQSSGLLESTRFFTYSLPLLLQDQLAIGPVTAMLGPCCASSVLYATLRYATPLQYYILLSKRPRLSQSPIGMARRTHCRIRFCPCDPCSTG